MGTSKELQISPEGLELANKYLQCNSVAEAAAALCITEEKATTLLNKPEVKRYVDSIYLDLGYRNKFKLGALLDEIIESKLEEARESEMYSSKDLLEIVKLAHNMRMDELKMEAQNNTTNIKNQTNVQVNDNSQNAFGQGNYGKLMEKLLNENSQ